MRITRSLAAGVRLLTSSVWRPSWYVTARSLPARHTTWFFLALHTAVAATLTVPFLFVVAVFDLHAFADRAAEGIIAAYPPELEIRLEDHRLTINQDLPYTVAMPDSARDFFGVSPQAMHNDLVLFTSEDAITPASLLAEEAPVIVTESHVYLFEFTAQEDENGAPVWKKGGMNVLALEDIDGEWTADAATIADFTQSVRETMRGSWFFSKIFYVPVLTVSFLIGVTALMFLFRGIQILFFAFAAWLIALLFFREQRWTFGAVLQRGVYAVTPLLIIRWILSLLGMPGTNTLLLFVLFLVWMSFLFSRDTKQATVAVATAPGRGAPARGKKKS